ncbi:MAG: acylneuraminate cytidylyltransferase family protein [Bacteroidetes bacterium]|nr:acylneuraminate cytidylyltransferase family protein [Bacteroidota bacterium]
MEVLAIIPARGGSKGLPNKNILPLLNHPLIAYSIKAALDSQLINRTIVSTDSAIIAQTALKYHAEVPFMRPDEFAQDMSTDFEVYYHALNWLKENEGYVPDYVVQLRPTSPIRSTKIIDDCIQRLSNSNADSLRIVTPSPITPYKMWTIQSEEMPMTPLLSLNKINEPYNQPRQKLPQTYWQIGFLDVIKTSTILDKKSMSGKSILPYIVSNEFAIDIDDISSFVKAAEVLSKSKEYVQF